MSEITNLATDTKLTETDIRAIRRFMWIVWGEKGFKADNKDSLTVMKDELKNTKFVIVKVEVIFRLYHTDANTKKIYELNPDTLEVMRSVDSAFGTPDSIGGGWDGSKMRLFHTDGAIKRIYELNPDTLMSIKSGNSIHSMPTGIGGGWDGEKLRLYHVDSSIRRTYELNTETLQVINTGKSYKGKVTGIGGGWDGGRLRLFLVSNEVLNIYELNLYTLQHIRGDIGGGVAFPRDVGGGYDGNKLRFYFTSTNRKEIFELNLSTSQRTNSVASFGDMPIGIGGTCSIRKYVEYNDERIYLT